MKKDLKEQLIIKKAMDALKKQAIREQELRKLKGGIDLGNHGQTQGMLPD
ncbi:MAG: hypothetical protein AAF985_22350 [Bacteroidota bacterium]